MDPLSLLVTAWVLTVFFNRLPDVMREMEFAKRGEMSPVYEARLKRLADAGIDPATGGAARQYLGNAWRDAWLDLEESRAKRRAERRSGSPTVGGPSLSDRMGDRFDRLVQRGADRWRRRDASEQVISAGSTTDPTVVEEPAVVTPQEPGAATPDAAQPDPPADVTEPPDAAGRAGPPSQSEPAADLAPVRVPSTVGESTRDVPPERPATPVSEGEPTMTAVVQVTGVVSGAAEARAIQRQVEAATAAFEAAMRLIRNRINNLGSQTLGEVQQAGHSRVVSALQQAAEAAAAAEADAKRCSAETGPALGIAARHFDRLNS